MGAPALPTSTHATLAGHEAPVLAARFSKDGAYLLTAGKDRTFRLWNPRKGTCIKTYAGHAREVRDVDAAADNSRLATCGGDKDVFLWDVTSGSRLRRFRGHEGGVNAVAFAGENDSVVVSAGFDRTVRFFDARSASRDAMHVIGGISSGDRNENENETFRDAVTSVAVSDTKILAGSVDGTVKTFDVRAGVARSDDFGEDNPVVSVAFSGDGACALVGTVNDRLALLDIEQGELLAEYRGRACRHSKVSARLTHDDAHVVAAGEDGVVTMWDLVDADVKARVDAHVSPRVAVTALDWHPKRSVMATGGADGNVRVWVPPGESERYARA
jgi:mitogen-activated protein kinase organizer 1